MAIPAVSVQFDFSNSPTFGITFTIGDPVHGVLGTDVLGDVASDIVDISDQVGKININRGYNLLQDQFQAGTAKVRVYDPTGKWNPQNASSVYYGKLLPLRKIRITANTQFLFSGYTTAYNYTYPTKDQDLGYVDIECVDAFRLFNMANVSTVTGAVAGETTGQRIGRILDTVSWPASMRTIATGNTTVAADPGSTRTSLAAIKNIEFSEQGAFYVSPTGNAVFKNRKAIVQKSGNNATSFANDGTGIGYKNIVFNFDDKLIINQVNVTRSGGTLQNAFNSTSITKYFPHSINFTDILVQTDADALDIARTYCATRAETTIRIDAMTLDLNSPSYDAGVTAAITLDFFDTVSIKNVGQDGTVIQKTLQCMGFQHEITPNSFNTTITTSEPIVDGFQIGSTLYGIIGTSVMTY
jgi:hypothetical protein